MGNQMNAAEQEYMAKLLSETFTLEHRREQAGLCRRCGHPDSEHSRAELEMGEGNGTMTIIGCPPRAWHLPPVIDWSKRYYLLQDGTIHYPRDSRSSLDDIGPFCIRFREIAAPRNGAFEGRMHETYENGERLRLFGVRGEAQEFCDWLNRRQGSYFFWPSDHRGLIEAP